MATYDAIVVGGGHNGLVAAAYLAKRRRKVLVLERAERVGGILANVELAEGFTAPGVAHTVGRLRKSVIAELELERHGFEPIEPDVRVFAPQPDGSGITLWADAARTAEGLRASAPVAADRYVAFDKRVRALASFLAHVNAATPPDVKTPSIADAINGLKLGKAFKGLGSKAGREATRALPMAIADFVREGVGEGAGSDPVAGALAARAVLYTSMGSWSAGSAAVFLNDSAGNDGGVAGQSTFAKGGSGALADALANAATAFGAEIRTSAEVSAIASNANGRATGVVLASGEQIRGTAIVTACDPKRTLTSLIDPVVLGPELVWRGGNIRTPGATAKVDLALSGMPKFNGADEERLRGRIVVSLGIDYLEKAADAWKYGAISEDPMLEITIPTLSDPSLAPEGRHVMSVLFQSAPYALREGTWDTESERLADVTVKALERYAPGLGELVVARRVRSPLDLEREVGLSGGHVYHGEPGLDDFFAWRPLLGHARYRFGIPGVYLAGSGAHPGGGVTGGPGANAAREILSDLKRKR
ncbi:MAG: NAD(P)/FAD-dependent oxidoreductase [Actinomycetota bacterium]